MVRAVAANEMQPLRKGDVMHKPVDIDALKALEAKATPGPWEWKKTGPIDFGYVGPGDKPTVMFGERHEGAVWEGNEDGLFLSALRNAAPALLAELAALREFATRMDNYASADDEEFDGGLLDELYAKHGVEQP